MKREKAPDAQADLFGGGWAQTEQERKFAEFDAANPHIWAQFVALAENRISHGFEQYSARDIMAYMRWHTPVSGDDGFKINNNWSSYFARKWRHLGLHPELPDFIEFRRAPKAEKEMGTEPCRDGPQSNKKSGPQQKSGSAV